MSGYTMVKRTAQKEGWAETAEVKEGTTWVVFSRDNARVEMWLDRSQAGPLVFAPLNSVLGAYIYEDDEKVGIVAGSGKVQQLQAYLKDGTLP